MNVVKINVSHPKVSPPSFKTNTQPIAAAWSSLLNTHAPDILLRWRRKFSGGIHRQTSHSRVHGLLGFLELVRVEDRVAKVKAVGISVARDNRNPCLLVYESLRLLSFERNDRIDPVRLGRFSRLIEVFPLEKLRIDFIEDEPHTPEFFGIFHVNDCPVGVHHLTAKISGLLSTTERSEEDSGELVYVVIC